MLQSTASRMAWGIDHLPFAAASAAPARSVAQVSKPSANKSVGLAAVALQTFSTEIVKTVVHAPSGVEILHGGIACEEPRYVEMLETVKLGRRESFENIRSESRHLINHGGSSLS